jgi:excinuclease UvrABC nuclease subunit
MNAPLWTVQQIIERSCPIEPPTPGVYFLIYEGQIIYVGQSMDVCNRHIQHRSEKRFDRLTYILCPVELLNDLEAAYIMLLKPPLNVMLPPNTLYVSLDMIKNKYGVHLPIVKKFLKAIGSPQAGEFRGQKYYPRHLFDGFLRWLEARGLA